MSSPVSHVENNENGIRWLHLTDLHLGSTNETQKTALRSLVDAVQKLAGAEKYDFVFITGDIAYSGIKKEYDAFDAQVVKPLRSLPAFAESLFVAVPGNHDLDCSVGFPPVWNSLGSSRQDKFFHLDKSGSDTRRSRAEAFKEYTEFTRRANILSVDPTNEPIASFSYEKGNRRFQILSVVTAFFSDKEVPDYQKSPAPTHAVRTLLHDLSEPTTVIVLAHHPLDWFMDQTENHLYSLLLENDVLYLNGHEHRIKSRFSGKGLASLGFGAAYQGASDSAPKSYYRNSFAICEMSDALHVQITSWDSEHGQWRPEQHLPADFTDRSTKIRDGYRLALPATKLIDHATRPYASIAAAVKTNFAIEKCVWLPGDDSKRWIEILSSIGQLRNVTDAYLLSTSTKAAGHSQFRIKDQRGTCLVHVITGEGDVLNYEQLQSINTELDRQSFDSCIVATLGSLSPEAHTLASQLSSRKSIIVFEKTQIVRELMQGASAALRQALRSIDPAFAKGSLVVAESGIAILLQERTSEQWFQVLGDDGSLLPEHHKLVLKLRDELPHLRTTRYSLAPIGARELWAESTDSEETFDKEQYLLQSYDHFDDVKYAPLAALGFRFRKASLTDIYVGASANVNGSSKPTHNVNRAITEFIESLNLSKTQRDQLESQVRSRLGIQTGAEVGAARQLYQRYNSVVVLGDPGSGKTCFVKHEFLAYCKPPEVDGGWYQNHIPIYVSLAEAARLANEDTDLLAICAILAARRGTALSRKQILKFLSSGAAAFFFDGLDEVGYIDTRISLVGQISELVSKYAARGNRFVIASRPAALQPVDIPEGLTYLQLKGLSEDEMRVLAGRVLTIRLGEEEHQEPTGDELDLVERLLEDTRNSPGIARIARNPLLLTLLVLIYANSGAVTARRHVIYTQAIKTLVSVRGRKTREQQISEADLRRRLGALAIAVFEREIADIPRRTEVLRVLRSEVRVRGGSQQQDDAMNAFIQEVAEATGLLSIHSSDEKRENDLITFMHYSFLEYYAATGLLGKDYLKLVPLLAGNSRWRDVITLLFGVLSEQGDVTPLIEAMLAESSDAENITRSRFLLTLESAAECDVPPEASQEILVDKIYHTVAFGAGRYSSKLREALAGRLETFLQGSNPLLEDVLIQGLSSSDPVAAAAFADLIARLGEGITLSDLVVEAFAECIGHKNPVCRCAVLFAVERRKELRLEALVPALRQSLRGTLSEKDAALKTIAAVPAYFEETASDIRNLLDDANSLISGNAAQCILSCAVGTQYLSSDSALQEKMLAKLGNSQDAETGIALPRVTLDRGQIESLVNSSDPRESELAIRYIPLVRDDPLFVHQLLSRSMRSASGRRQAACLDSFRFSARAIDLITLADTDVICELATKAERNVRVAAVRLLGEMPNDEQVVGTLLNRLSPTQGGGIDDREIVEAAKAISKHARKNQQLRKQVLTEVFKRIPESPSSGFGDEKNQQRLHALLLVYESLGGAVNDATAGKFLALAESYKTPDTLRRQAMRVFGKIAPPTPSTVETFIKALSRNDPRFIEASYSAISFFIAECQKKVESIRSVHRYLGDLQTKLCDAWKREAGAAGENIDVSGGRDIRNALIGIEELLLRYNEFSNQAQLKDTVVPTN